MVISWLQHPVSRAEHWPAGHVTCIDNAIQTHDKRDGASGEEYVLMSEQTMWRVEAPSGRSVTCYVARLPTTDYELRIMYADQVLSYEVYSELRHAVERGTAVKERMVEFVKSAAKR